MPSFENKTPSNPRTESQRNLPSLSSIAILAAIVPHPRQTLSSKPQMTSRDLVLLLEEALLLCEDISKYEDNDDEPIC
jgi:hypothetical protein